MRAQTAVNNNSAQFARHAAGQIALDLPGAEGDPRVLWMGSRRFVFVLALTTGPAARSRVNV